MILSDFFAVVMITRIEAVRYFSVSQEKDLRVLSAAILLGSIKVPYTELKRRIVEVDEEQLDVAQLEQLIRYMPEPEQMKQLAALKDEYDTLSEAEQFGVVVRAACTLSIHTVVHSLLTFQVLMLTRFIVKLYMVGQ